MQTGDVVKIEEVEGMSTGFEDNKEDPVPVSGKAKNINAYFYIEEDRKHPSRFFIADTSALGEYTKGGKFTTVKMPKKFHADSLAKQLVR